MARIDDKLGERRSLDEIWKLRRLDGISSLRVSIPNVLWRELESSLGMPIGEADVIKILHSLTTGEFALTRKF